MKITITDGYITTVHNETMTLTLEEDVNGFSYRFEGPDTYASGESERMSQTAYAVVLEAFLESEESGDMARLTEALRYS